MFNKEPKYEIARRLEDLGRVRERLEMAMDDPVWEEVLQKRMQLKHGDSEYDSQIYDILFKIENIQESLLEALLISKNNI